ncbi:MAG: radical SAM protein [Asgard group archaeon]|nr:radical SAM protein [Asgard group archaeon]
MKYQFIHSTREHPSMGYTLYINLFEDKTCTLDCFWCSFGKTKLKTDTRTSFFPVSDVLKEISSFIDTVHQPESIFILSKGESVLYADLGQLINDIKNKYPDVKIGIWTNATLLAQKEIRGELALCDYVTADLNVTNEADFIKLHKPVESIIFANVVKGLDQFSKEYKGFLTISITFLKDFNDSEENLDGLRQQLESISPKEIIVNFRKERNTEALEKKFVDLLKKKFKGLPYKITLQELH